MYQIALYPTVILPVSPHTQPHENFTQPTRHFESPSCPAPHHQNLFSRPCFDSSLTVFWKMKEILCRLLPTHCVGRQGGGLCQASTPRQLRELQAGLPKRTFLVKNWGEKKNKFQMEKLKMGKRFYFKKSQIGGEKKKRLKPCFWNLMFLLFVLVCSSSTPEPQEPAHPDTTLLVAVLFPEGNTGKLRKMSLNITPETKFSILIWTGHVW